MQTSFPVCHCWICPKYPNKVLRLNKALYGLKQAPRIWYLLLCGVIVGLGFQVLETGTSIYVRGEIIIEVYVDDIKIIGPKQELCYEVYYRSEERRVGKEFITL